MVGQMKDMLNTPCPIFPLAGMRLMRGETTRWGGDIIREDSNKQLAQEKKTGKTAGSETSRQTTTQGVSPRQWATWLTVTNGV